MDNIKIMDYEKMEMVAAEMEKMINNAPCISQDLKAGLKDLVESTSVCYCCKAADAYRAMAIEVICSEDVDFRTLHDELVAKLRLNIKKWQEADSQVAEAVRRIFAI